MVKKTSLVILALCMIIITAMSAMALVPLVIYGKAVFGGTVYSDAQVTITDGRGNTWYEYTSSEGVYTIDASNLKRSDMSYVSQGDYLTLRVCPSDITGCSKNIKVSEIPQEVSFGVTTDPTIIPVKCPVCPPEVVCPVCPVCPDVPAGTELWHLIAGALAALGLGGAGGYLIKRKEAMSKGVGLKIYTGRDGKEKVLHKHPGIKGYHDPFTSHKDKKVRHDKGELTPKYKKDDSGDWVYQA